MSKHETGAGGHNAPSLQITIVPYFVALGGEGTDPCESFVAIEVVELWERLHFSLTVGAVPTPLPCGVSA